MSIDVRCAKKARCTLKSGFKYFKGHKSCKNYKSPKWDLWENVYCKIAGYPKYFKIIVKTFAKTNALCQMNVFTNVTF